MANSFYWYDLETSGLSPKWDRIVQFAGCRTDAELNLLDDEYITYVSLPDDVLPNPNATLVTGITPSILESQGIREIDALRVISRSMSEPGTCVVGYNNLRFDDEFIRYSFYRNFLDPYSREWKNGNSRWDLLDLVRATGALRRDGINWPQDEEGLPVYKLEELTKHNQIEHGSAHDALSDVRATIGMAKLIYQNHPKIFEYYFALRDKKQVRQVLEPYGIKTCLHISGIYPRARFGVAPVISLARHPTNNNAVIVADLAEDIDSLVAMTSEEIKSRLYSKDFEDRLPLREIRINRCPFVVGFDVLTPENIDRLEIDIKIVEDRAKKLRQPGVGQKIASAFEHPNREANTDVDAALYEGFLQDEDRSRCLSFHQALERGEYPILDFRDKRLTVLLERLKMRSFPEFASDHEKKDWSDWVGQKLLAEGDHLNLKKFQSEIEQLRKESLLPEKKHRLLDELLDYAQKLTLKYQLGDTEIV